MRRDADERALRDELLEHEEVVRAHCLELAVGDRRRLDVDPLAQPNVVDPFDVVDRPPQVRLHDDAEILVPELRAGRGTGRGCGSSSTSPPCRFGRSSAAPGRRRRPASRFSRHRPRSRSSPSAVSLIEMFESSSSLSIRASRSWYWPAIARASSALVISSPSTSTVASFPCPFSSPTTRAASSIVEPAM